MKLSVAICTHNRAAWIGAAVESVVADNPAIDVLIVDNASTDRTSEVVKGLVARYRSVSAVVEPKLGLSNARNRAIGELAGGVVVFLDDDAVVSPGWSDAHLRPYVDPNVAAVGGPVEPVWPRGRPKWMPTEVEAFYSALDLGTEPRDFRPDEYPVGANMSIRHDVAASLLFNPKLGRMGASLVSNEETHFFDRLRERWRIAYEPEARVRHEVVEGRDTLRWLLRRSFAAGRSAALAAGLRGESVARERAAVTIGLDVARCSVLRGGGQRGLSGGVASASRVATGLGVLTFRAARER